MLGMIRSASGLTGYESPGNTLRVDPSCSEKDVPFPANGGFTDDADENADSDNNGNGGDNGNDRDNGDNDDDDESDDVMLMVVMMTMVAYPAARRASRCSAITRKSLGLHFNCLSQSPWVRRRAPLGPQHRSPKHQA